MVASLQLLLMLIGAFALKTDDKDNGTYDGVVVAALLMAMNVCVFILGFWTIAYAFPNVKVVIDTWLQKCGKFCAQRCKLKKNKKGQLATVSTLLLAASPPGNKTTGSGKNKYKVHNKVIDKYDMDTNKKSGTSIFVKEEESDNLEEVHGKSNYKIHGEEALAVKDVENEQEVIDDKAVDINKNSESSPLEEEEAGDDLEEDLDLDTLTLT